MVHAFFERFCWLVQQRWICQHRQRYTEGGYKLKQTTSTCQSHDTIPAQQHICIVSETYAPEINGVALTLARLTEGLRTAGCRVSIVRPRQRTVDPPGDAFDSLTLVRGVPFPGRRGIQFGLPAADLLLRQWTRRRPDVLYVATEGPLAWSAVRTAQRLAIPVLSGFHTNFHTYSKYYRLGWLQRLILCYLRSFHNRTAGTVVPSADMRNQLQHAGFTNISILDHGVDSHVFSPTRRSASLRAQWGLADDDVAVLYVGRVVPEKNLHVAVDAYHAMQRSGKPLKWIIVGDGPLRPRLQRQHADVIFCGILFGERLAEHYASADVFLFPSETETFGNVTLEAMASGLAVVAYDYAAAHLHIRHEQNGLLAPLGCTQAFVDAASRLVHEPHTRNILRRHARRSIVGFDWQRVVKRFELLLMNAGARAIRPERALATPDLEPNAREGKI